MAPRSSSRKRKAEGGDEKALSAKASKADSRARKEDKGQEEELVADSTRNFHVLDVTRAGQPLTLPDRHPLSQYHQQSAPALFHHGPSLPPPLTLPCDGCPQISASKKVVVMRKSPVQFYEGPAARRLVGLPTGGKKSVKAQPPQLAEFVVFVQSTSVNRKLEKGTRLVIELDESEHCGP